MDFWNTVLEIIASLFSILAIIISWISKKHVDEIKNEISNSNLLGNDNNQNIGTGNTINNHDK